MINQNNESLEYLRSQVIKQIKRLEMQRANAVARLEALNFALNQMQPTVKVDQHELFTDKSV